MSFFSLFQSFFTAKKEEENNFFLNFFKKKFTNTNSSVLLLFFTTRQNIFAMFFCLSFFKQLKISWWFLFNRLLIPCLSEIFSFLSLLFEILFSWFLEWTMLFFYFDSIYMNFMILFDIKCLFLPLRSIFEKVVNSSLFTVCNSFHLFFFCIILIFLYFCLVKKESNQIWSLRRRLAQLEVEGKFEVI